MSVDLLAKKKAFAVALLSNPTDAHAIAFRMFPAQEDTSVACDLAANWRTDTDVLQFMQNAEIDPLSMGALPDKHQAAREVLDRARKCDDAEVYGKLMRLYADMMGQIEKPGNSTPINITVNKNKVLVMPAPVAKDEWSAMAVTQQRELSCGSS